MMYTIDITYQSLYYTIHTPTYIHTYVNDTYTHTHTNKMYKHIHKHDTYIYSQSIYTFVFDIHTRVLIYMQPYVNKS